MSNGILAKYITKEFTVIYLCVKEHKITKLKYFCKTTKINLGIANQNA
jgi:hypothetical protein